MHVYIYIIINLDIEAIINIYTSNILSTGGHTSVYQMGVWLYIDKYMDVHKNDGLGDPGSKVR